ncbi:MAG: excisionase family DNA-binding protein [Desulfovibrio sp.]|nr:excisionase family DNA-binding protein [Desulfovibrio sp.]
MSQNAERGRKLNWRQACEVIGCSKRQFYRLIHKGVLPAYQLPGSKRGLWVWEHDCKDICCPVSSHEEKQVGKQDFPAP